MQADRVGPGHGHHQVGPLDRQPGHRVAAQADLVVEELLVLLEAEAGVDHGDREGGPEQLEQRLPGARADLGPQLGPGQPGQDPGTAGSGPPDRLPEPQGVQLAPSGDPGRPGQPGRVVEEPERLRDGASIGVGVDQQDLTAGGGRLEGEVDGDGRAARAALRPPDRRQDPPPVAVRLCRGRPGPGGSSASAGVAAAGSGSVARAARARSTSASGGSASEATCRSPSWRRRRSLSSSPAAATPTTASPARGQPGQRVPVQPAGPGGDHRHLGLSGGGHGEQVAQVVAPVQHLRRQPARPGRPGPAPPPMPPRPRRSPAAPSPAPPPCPGPVSGPSGQLGRARAGPGRVRAVTSQAGTRPGCGVGRESRPVGGRRCRRRPARWPGLGP